MSDKILKLSQAQTLYQDLRERSAPVITKSAVGNPIMFTDGANGLSLSKCKLTLLPRQSGSGDASPENVRPLIPWENVGTWTGGKNLLKTTASSKETAGVKYTVNSDGTITVSGTASGYSDLELGTCFIPPEGKITVSGLQNVTNIRWDVIRLYDKDDNIVANNLATLSSNPITINISDYPTACKLYLKVKRNNNVETSGTIAPMVEIGEQASAFTPYTPITPHPVNVGKNLLNVDDSLKLALNSTYSHWSSTDGVITITGNATGGYIMPCKPSTKYAYSFEPTYRGSYMAIRVYEFSEYPVQLSSGTLIYNENSNANRPPVTFTTTENAQWLVVGFYGHKLDGDIVLRNVQVEEGEQATAFQPYLPPVYGCEIDLTTGEVWGTYIGTSFRYGDIPVYVVGNEMENKRIDLSGKAIHAGQAGANNAVCNYAKYLWKTSADQTPHFYQDWISSANATRIYLYMPVGTDEDLQFTFALPLETPVLLATLTPQQISAIVGVNTVWSDANNIDIEYRADTELFINQNGVKDVQINGTSVTTDGVANVPIAGPTTPGVAIVRDSSDGLKVDSANRLILVTANASMIKGGTSAGRAITPSVQDASAFYALAKLAGADMSQSSNAVGTYTDAAKQGIQKMLGLDGLVGPYEADITADQAYAIGETFVMDGKRYKATATIAQGGIITPGTNCEFVPLDGQYVRKTDIANQDNAGVVKVNTYGAYGIRMSTEINGDLRIMKADSTDIKSGTPQYRPIVPYLQHESVFYGLAKAAGDITQSSSSNAIGTYTTEAKAAILAMIGANGPGLAIVNGSLRTDSASMGTIKLGGDSTAPIVSSHVHDATFFGLAKAAGANMASLSDVTVGVYPQAQKTAIQSMLGIEADIPLIETVSGSAPTIIGMPNVRYICGEVTLLTITPPATGSIVVRFSTGSSTTLTVPDTVKWPAWFDATSLDVNTTYEIIITDGVYGGVMSWA